ncbi:hypothetical protein HPP92_014734 [Vanilla planifolia]|uniref:Expansin-like EG45 domain-containing protein n=1 Tax=Vanilla planifolia TaxID=51239 RepID=A0A835QNV4_VANPL|nr:hypothetical protein HPP92_015238 [Vanilla planifolia]KAG0475048.1 hypothetical protein HPP92_014734 [Vanilla planifolia]
MEKLIIAAAVMLFSLAYVSATPGTAKSLSQGRTDLLCNLGQNRSNSIDKIQLDSLPGKVYASMANPDAWDYGAACGKMFCVMCTGSIDPTSPSPCRKDKYIFITIYSYCHDCETSFSIAEKGFNTIAEPNVSTIKIDYAM